MSKHERWLRQEVAQWRSDGLVDDALAQRILARYPATSPSSWAWIILPALGALLGGLGVILFFAYNWQAMPKAVKLALVFGALAATHGAGLQLARRPDANRALVEGLHALGTMLFGAGIWLVAQIYHIDEHYPNAFVVWSLGALALAWAMPSVVQAYLALLLITFWAGLEAIKFHRPMHGAPVLVLLGVLPLALWQRSPALLASALAVLFVATALSIAWLDGDAVLPLLYLMGAAAVFAAVPMRTTRFAAADGPLHAIGLLVVLGCSFVLSFPSMAGIVRHVDFERPEQMIYFGMAGAALAAGLGAAAVLVRNERARIDAYRGWQLVLVGIGVAVVIAGTLFRIKGGWIIALPFNVVVLGLALLLILQGSAQLRAQLVGAGCVLFALVTIGRYADLFTSLLVRSAVFVVLGIALFWVGMFYARRRRHLQASTP